MAYIEFYTIFRWMRDELNLSGTELDCYAVIYNLAQGDNRYVAGVRKLMELLHKSEPTIISALKNLAEKGLVHKEPVVIKNIKRFYYKAIRPSDNENDNDLNNLSSEDADTLNNLSSTTLNNLSSIKEINNKEIKEKRNINISQKENTRFIKPTIEEIDEYIKEKGFHFDAEQFFDHYESVDWMRGKNKLKDWKAACRYWEHGNKKKEYEPLSTDEDKVKRFKLWMREKHSGIEFCEKPLTFDGYMRLQREYGMDEVCNQLDYIDANIGKFKKCDIELVIKQYLDKQ